MRDLSRKLVKWKGVPSAEASRFTQTALLRIVLKSTECTIEVRSESRSRYFGVVWSVSRRGGTRCVSRRVRMLLASTRPACSPRHATEQSDNETPHLILRRRTYAAQTSQLRALSRQFLFCLNWSRANGGHVCRLRHCR